jgi:hypothetical protein
MLLHFSSMLFRDNDSAVKAEGGCTGVDKQGAEMRWWKKINSRVKKYGGR